MWWLLLLAFDIPDLPTGCVVDKCEKDICTIETPEGFVDVKRKPEYYEGKIVACPFWLIDPT